jgi:hypothetical protein
MPSMRMEECAMSAFSRVHICTVCFHTTYHVRNLTALRLRAGQTRLVLLMEYLGKRSAIDNDQFCQNAEPSSGTPCRE